MPLMAHSMALFTTGVRASDISYDFATRDSTISITDLCLFLFVTVLEGLLFIKYK